MADGALSAAITEVALGEASIERYRPLVEGDVWSELERTLGDLAAATRGRVIWNVNSTPRGGGVAELLHALVPYERGAGIDARWAAVGGPPEFFALTKRIHALLHGASPDGTELTAADSRLYETTTADNARALEPLVRPGDVVILHDPQTAGLAPALAGRGCRVIWRCHIGADQPNEVVRATWDFLHPYVSVAEVAIFSRRAYVWEGLERNEVIAPCIDAFTAKNYDLDPEAVLTILRAAGLLQPAATAAAATFVRRDGSSDRVQRVADVLEDSPPAADEPLVVQVSRWDRLKDPDGVLEGFVRHVAPHAGGHLVLAGPAVEGVADDPEEPRIMRRLEEQWRQLAPDARARVHLARLPMEDEEENAVMVNALQRHAQVVVQKSLAEGFGLTVAEAMWKARPVVASRVGGIEDQVEDGRSGLLVDDPRDLDAFGRAVVSLLGDPETGLRLGSAARERVGRQFLAPRHLIEQGRLVRRLLG